MSLIIPIFISHQGCPHTCIFCNQHRISGQGKEVPVTPSDVKATVSLWLDRDSGRTGDEVQVAFYGGSFTGLPLSRQQELLEAVAPFIENGQVKSIRLSTRPDYIDSKTVEFLRNHGVSTVELGVQSLDDRVLEASFRGHKAEHTTKAVGLLRKGGMKIGLQLMLGMPEQSTRSMMQTVKEAAILKPDFVRIYPMLVLEESRLFEQYSKGEYKPLTLDKAVVQVAWMKKYFDARSIKVIRMGLQAGPELEQSLVAGPYHPAFGELVSARIMLQRTRKALQGVETNCQKVLSISDRDMSIFRGLNSSNIKRLNELGLTDRFRLVTDRSQQRFTLKQVNHAQCQ